MPFTTAYTLSKVLIFFMTAVPVAIVVTAPTSSDYWAVAGAAWAALLSGLHVLSKRRTYWHLALNIISAGAVGTLGPGVLLWLLHIIHEGSHNHIQSTMTWQAYGAGGLFCGLGGWAIIHAIMQRWERHADDLASRPFRFFDDATTYRDDDDQ